jgi:hypothetical protein
MTDNATITTQIVSIDFTNADNELIHVLVSARLTEESGEIADMSFRVPIRSSLDSTIGEIAQQAKLYVKRLLPVVELH